MTRLKELKRIEWMMMIILLATVQECSFAFSSMVQFQALLSKCSNNVARTTEVPVQTRCWSSPGLIDPSSDDIVPSSLPPLPSPPTAPPLLLQHQQRRRWTVPYPVNPSTPEWTNSTILLTIKSAANWASLLCVLDCTVLPLLSVLLPLVGWLNLGTAAFQQTMGDWTHDLALYFVVPVGTTTVVMNYITGHRNRTVVSIGVFGLLLVALANVELLDGIQGLPPATLILAHRIINLVGCALLLGSNYLSQQLGCDCGIPFCRPINTNNNKNHPLLVVPLLPSTTVTATAANALTTTTIPSAMSLQTRMIQHKQLLETRKQSMGSVDGTST